MAAALIKHEQIKTTLPKAKDLRRVVDRSSPWASAAACTPPAGLSSLRETASAVAKLFETLAERYKERPGGYTRVLKAGFRYGDMRRHGRHRAGRPRPGRQGPGFRPDCRKSSSRTRKWLKA